MQQLSRTDAGFLAAETPSWHMHAGGVAILDPSGAPRGFGVDELRRLIEQRLSLLGLFRHRLVEAPGRLDRPMWIDQPELDVAAHLREARLPPSSGPRELGKLVGDIFATKLERDRPLWEIWHVDGLPDGNVALVLKIHHACVDGVRGAQLYDVIFDLEPDAPLERPGLAALPGERPPSTIELLGRTGASVATTPLRAARAVADVTRAATRLAPFRRPSALSGAVLPFEAPRSPLNGRLTPRRSFAYSSVPFARALAVKQAADVTLNDVVLAMCAGALRRWLLDRDALPHGPLVAQVPVGVRREDPQADSRSTPGNFVSAMWAALPVQLADPEDRLRAVHASTRAGKTLHRALGEDLLADLVDVPPPAFISGLVHAYTRLHLDALHPPIFNVIVSTVPTVPVPVFSAGARVLAIYPIGPLLAGSGLNITSFSYVDSLDIGILACPDIVEDEWAIADAMPEALDELHAETVGV